MAVQTREPLIRYLCAHATMLRQTGTPRAAAERLELHARALELLADYVQALADDDERLLLLGTLAVRGGDFVPGPAAEHALNQFTGISGQESATFLGQLTRIARDDALARARELGFLPPRPP
jgi:hypothetical protein